MKKNLKKFSPILLFLILTVVITRPYFFQNRVPFASNLLVSFYEPWKTYGSEGYHSGPPNKPIGFDSLRIFYPYRMLTTESLKKFTLPLWNPYSFSGNTHLATYQTAVFHPLTLLFFILPLLDAWSIAVILQPLLASFFTYIFLRSLKLSKKSSSFGAIGWGFCGIFIVLMEETFMAGYSALFLPLILYGIRKLYQKISAKNFVLFVLGLSGSILSGWFQMTFYVFSFSFIWAIFLLFERREGKIFRWKPFFWILIGFLIAFLISSVHLFPNIESYKYSARGTTDAKFVFDQYLLPLSHLVTYIVPDFWGNPAAYNYFNRGFYYEKVLYVGVVVLFFGLYELFRFRKVTKTESFFKVFWIVSLSLGFALPTSWFLLYHLKLPFLSTILPSRIFILSAFCLSVLSAYGIERYTNSVQKRQLFLTLGIISLSLVFIWKFVLAQKGLEPLGNYATISYRNLFLPSVISIAIVFFALGGIFIGKKWRERMYYLFLGISLVSIGYFSNKYLYFSERRFVFPQVNVISTLQKVIGPNRFWSFGEGYIERNFSTYFKIQSIEGYDSFYIQPYGELLFAAQKDGKLSPDVPRADVSLSNTKNLSEVVNNQYRMKLLSLLGTKFIIGKVSQEDEDFIKRDSEKTFSKHWTDGIYTIYQFNNSLKRAFLVDNFVVRGDKQDILNNIFDQKTDLSKTIVLEEKPSIRISKVELQDSAVIELYESQKVVIQTTANKDSLLFLSDNHYPGWKVFVDGKKEKLYKADYTFRAVAVPTGKHTVEFRYEPSSFLFGLIGSTSGIVLFVLAIFVIQYNSRTIRQKQ